MIKATFDTNVFVSALCKPSGVCGALFKNGFVQLYELASSESILDEVLRVGRRECFRKYFDTDGLEKFVEELKQEARLADEDKVKRCIRKLDKEKFTDVQDMHVVAAFQATDSDYLVTGNVKHFEMLRDQLVTPKRFFSILSLQ